MSNKNEATMEKAKEALKNVELVEQKKGAVLVEESWKISESELLRICWKKDGSLHTYLASLGKFLKSVEEVVVSEVENSEEMVFSLTKRKAADVLNLMSSNGTNSLEKLKTAPQKVQVQDVPFSRTSLVLCSRRIPRYLN